MRRPVKWLLWIGLPLAAIAFITWQLPADFVLRRLPDHGVPLRYESAEGSIWRGSATGVRWRGLPLQRVEWRFLGPGRWPGLTHRWAFHGEGGDYQLDGRLSLNGSRIEAVERLAGELPAHWVDLSQVAPFVVLLGRLQIDIEEAEFDGGQPRRVEGNVEWRQAGLSGLVEEQLGRLLIELDARRNGTAFRLRSLESAPLMFDGDGEIDGNGYEVSLALRASPERMPTLRELAHLGRLEGDTLTIDWSGEVLPP